MKTILFSVLLFFSVSLCGEASAEPLFETSRVFAASADNRPNHRIPSLLQAKNGDLLVLCERRNHGPGDIGDHDIVMKRSSDRGRTWGKEILILDDGVSASADLTAGVDPVKGTLWLFFLRDKKRFAYLTSHDHGHTWSDPVGIHDQVADPAWDALRGPPRPESRNPKGHAARWERDWWQRYGCGPGNTVLFLKSGRILVPARHREDIGGGRLRSFAHCFYSDDGGETWDRGGTIGLHTGECQFVELADGSVRVVSRNENAEDAPDNLRHLTAISRDGGETWSEPQRQEELITPRCHGSVARYDATRLLFSSPASPFRQPEHPYGRYNLTVRMSHDEGATWSAGRTIWPHPSSYSDLLVLDDGTVGCVYERGDKGSTRYWDELHFARFDLTWLGPASDPPR